jgi:hypothetical protein
MSSNLKILFNSNQFHCRPLHKLKENKSSPSADPVAMFVLQDYPVQMDVAISSIDGTVKLSAVAEGGSLNVFSETINGYEAHLQIVCTEC